jgi:hypothetical protein
VQLLRQKSLPHTLIKEKYFAKLIRLGYVNFSKNKQKLREAILTERQRINDNTINMLIINASQ